MRLSALEDTASNPHYSCTFRVYWEDTDAGGVVYYANYLKFMERCRTAWLRALGVDQQRLRLERQMQFAVVGLTVDFLRPAVLDDEIVVTADNFLPADDHAGRHPVDRREYARCLSRFRHAETACHP